tara:strand:- start:337 stop:1110 length:774 start_codon:yes stop_codon:yes gene_type:complete
MTRINKTKNEIKNALINAVKKENNLLRFLHISMNMEMISRKLQKDNLEGKIKLDNTYINTIKSYKLSEELLEKEGKSITDFQNELTYKLYFQVFEELLFDLFVILFQNFPEYLNKEKFDLNFDLIFNQNDIEIIRKKVIEGRAKKYIQGNNIKIIIEKFKTIFGIKISIPKNEMDKIFTASKIRNILTHNSGIINDFYINELKYEKIISNYNLGDSIVKNLGKEIDFIENIIINIGEEITNQIISKLNQLDKHSSSL